MKSLVVRGLVLNSLAMSARLVLAGAGMLAVSVLPTLAQQASPVPETPPKSFQPEVQPPSEDTWIFSGNLQGTNESFSGTLVATKEEGQFELKLGSGATCDGSQFSGGLGMIRLPEITCSDNRSLRALFVPQDHDTLKVFGHLGDQRFAAEAHLLGTDAPPAPQPSAAPHGPLGLPPK